MTRQVFTLPDLGEGLTDAQLSRWLVKLGDTVALDAPIAEVETAKAMVEVPSPYGGVVAELHSKEGATILVGEPLITIDSQHPDAPSSVDELPAGSGNVLVGYGTGEHSNGRRRRRKDRRNTTPAVPASLAPRAERPRAASPIVRKLAKDSGVDLKTIRGTGHAGLITRADVEHAAHTAAQQHPVAQLVPEPAAHGTDRRTGLPIQRRIPLQGMRKAIAATLSRSRQEIPEATTWVDVDATALLELRRSLNDGPERGPGLLAILARFVVAGLARFPELNSQVDLDIGEIQVYGGVNLGIATHTERGLVVPVARGAHRLTARGLDAEIRRVVDAVRGGSATAAELNSGSFTLNNYGSFGVDGSAAIIHHPEAAILGIGRIIERAWIVEGRIVPRHLTQLSLVFDHRVCDGRTAAGFLRFVADAMQDPQSALADL